MANFNDITVIILTYNEELHIERCIKSIRNVASDVVVIDSYSTDSTTEIASKLGARVFCNVWKNHSTQFNWGLDNADIKTNWIFRIDADEVLEGDGQELLQLDNLDEDITGINIQRKYYFMGKWIKHGAMYPSSHLRIWRHPFGRVEDRWMDERTILYKGRTINLDLKIIDDNLNPLDWWIDKHNRYATREMVDTLNLKYKFIEKQSSTKNLSGKEIVFKRIAKEKIYSSLPLFIRPLPLFLYRYIIRLGFVDGAQGFLFHFLQTFWYRMLVDAKIFEAKSWLGAEESPERIKQILKSKTQLDL